MSQLQPTPRVASDEDIVHLLRIQDPAGLRHLLQKYGHRVRRNLRHEMGGVLGSSDLDEVLNRAAYLAWRHAGSYTAERGRLATWFYIIARNTALSLVKDARPSSGKAVVESVDLAAIGSEEGVPLGQSADSVSSHLDPRDRDEQAPSERQEQFVTCFRACIEELPPQQKAIIQADLAAGEIVDAGELARNLNSTRESIYASRSNARKALRIAMRNHGYFGGPDADAGSA